MKIQNLCRNLRQRIMPSFCFVPLWERIRSGADCRLAELIANKPILQYISYICKKLGLSKVQVL